MPKKSDDQQKKTKWASFSEAETKNVSNGTKQRAVDDSVIDKKNGVQNTNVVPLKSQDFTGLGFNICGNMRDGIFVKDLLHHGPASQSGHIKPGDRIAAVRINFSHMVYEDALAILSYASPYEVEVEIENKESWSPGSLKTIVNCSGDIKHPFYRSQSFSDAQKIQQTKLRNYMNGKTQNQEENSPVQPAVLEVTEISEKMPKYGGVKVLPDPTPSPTKPEVTQIEMQQSGQTMGSTTVTQEKKGNTLPSGFDEVDLGSYADVRENSMNQKETSNVKSRILRGLQNIKQKINEHINNKNVDKDQKVVQNNQNGITKDIKLQLKDESELESVVVISAETSKDEDIDAMDDQSKNSKRKPPAPMPPARQKRGESESLLNEIEKEVAKNMNDGDMHSTNKNVIQLNSSHITVHHSSDDSSRKAASLGDLHTMNETTSASLERTVSLELEDTPHNAKGFKAPLSLENSSEIIGKLETPKLETGKNTELKRSSLFGTLEEALIQSNEDNASIISIPDEELIASTPMPSGKHLDTNSDTQSWESRSQKDDDVFLASSEAPALPTSPIPSLMAYEKDSVISTSYMDSKLNNSNGTLFITAHEVSETSTGETMLPRSKHEETIKSVNEEDVQTITQNGFADTSENTSQNITNEKATSSRLNQHNIEESKNVENIDDRITYTDESSGIDVLSISDKYSTSEETCAMTISLDSGNQTISTPDTEHKLQNNVKKQNGVRTEIMFASSETDSQNEEEIVKLKPPTSGHSLTPKMNGEKSGAKRKSSLSGSKLPKITSPQPKGSRIPVRANTEPSLRLPLTIKEENGTSKVRKNKASDENDKSMSYSTHNLTSPKKSISPVRLNSSREATLSHITVDSRK